MPMSRHDLVGKQLDFVQLQRLREDFLKRYKIPFLAKNPRSQIRTVQSVVEAARFITSR